MPRHVRTKSIVEKKNQLIVRFLLPLKEKEENVSDIVNWDLTAMQRNARGETNAISVQIHRP